MTRKRAQTIVVKEFFNQVNVGENHSSTAISLQLKLIKGITKTNEESARAANGKNQMLTLRSCPLQAGPSKHSICRQ
jgi:hypothetical protein